MANPVKTYSDEPEVVIKLRIQLRVFKLIVAIPADNDEVLGMMALGGVKMVNLKERLLVSL